jgi:mRNA interferase MazF
VRRGEVWWVDFGERFGSEPGCKRPALVVQADPFNVSTIATVLIVPLSKSVGLAAAPGNLLCRPKDTGLRHPSVVNVSQLAVADRRRLLERVGSLPGRVMDRVDEGLRLVLGL